MKERLRNPVSLACVSSKLFILCHHPLAFARTTTQGKKNQTEQTAKKGEKKGNGSREKEREKCKILLRIDREGRVEEEREGAKGK